MLDTVGLADSWQSGLTNIAGAGSNRMLVFFASNEEQTMSTPPNVTGVTYGGRPLTSVVAEDVINGGCSLRVEMWILNESGLAAATGNTLVPSWTASPDTPLYSHAIFNNVDQMMPHGASTKSKVAGHTPNQVPMASVATSEGDMVIGAAVAVVKARTRRRTDSRSA